MNTAVAQLLSAARLARGLSREQVARMLGYRNVAKGVRRLAVAEALGRIKEELLVRLLVVLCLDLAEFEDAVAAAGRADEPVVVGPPSVKGQYPPELAPKPPENP